MGYGSTVATQFDIEISSGAKGIFVCYWPVTVWVAIQHTRRNKNPLKSLFLWMIWTLLVCTALKSTLSFLAMRAIVDPASLGVVIPTGICWALEIQLVSQIILNRMGIILPGSRTIFRLKIFYFVILLLINISVFGLWYPTIYGNERAGEILKIWDPVEICIVMVMDMCLNLYFIISVKRKLLSFGLGKYKTLIKANVLIILANLTTDVVLTTSYFAFPNLWFCEQFQALTYLFKTRIELQMATLILRAAAQETHFSLMSPGDRYDPSLNHSTVLNDVGRTISSSSSKRSDTMPTVPHSSANTNTNTSDTLSVPAPGHV